MKLAEALQERSDLNEKISRLRSRIYSNVLVQQGEKPVEDPVEMLEELKESVSRLEELIKKINLTNCKAVVDGVSLTEMIAKKDSLKILCNIYRETIEAAARNTDRARGTEIKIVSAVDVTVLRKKENEVAKELRLLDNKLQQANWTIDLIDN